MSRRSMRSMGVVLAWLSGWGGLRSRLAFVLDNFSVHKGDQIDCRSRCSIGLRASFPVIRRCYEPVADLDERLRRIFAVLSRPPLDW